MTQPPLLQPVDAPFTPDVAPGVPVTPPEKAGVWEDFIDILYTPSSVFARRETGSIWIPLLVVALLTGGLFWVNSGMLEPMMDAEFRRAMETARASNPQVTAEQMEQMRGFGSMMARIGAFIMMPIMILLVGVALWAAGKVVSATQTLHAAFVVAAYSFVPRIVEAFLTSVQGLLLDPASFDGRYRLSIGPGRFLDPDTASPLLLAVVGRLDLFTLWVTVLLAIGLAVTGRIPRVQAAVAAGLVWLAGGLPGIIGALRS